MLRLGGCCGFGSIFNRVVFFFAMLVRRPFELNGVAEELRLHQLSRPGSFTACAPAATMP